MVFLYEDISGDPYRIIPDGRTRAQARIPTRRTTAIRWAAGKATRSSSTSVGFVEETWFGEDGYFHSDAMRVTERFWRSGDEPGVSGDGGRSRRS